MLVSSTIERMKSLFLFQTIALVAGSFATSAFCEDLASAPPGSPTTIYRQVMPDGRIVYSDKAVKGGKVDQTITVEPPIKGNFWSAESGARPVIPPQTESTPVRKTSSIPLLGKKKTLAEATSDVIRAEMLLEDAKKRQEAGVEPLPGERTGNSANNGSRLNDTYDARQKALAKDVAAAEAALQQAIADRDALR